MARLLVRCGLMAGVVLALGSCQGGEGPAPPPVPAARPLRAVSEFAGMSDQKERSRALFLEASQVLLHPRCANCHPDGDVPAQGMQMTRHQPPVTRGPEAHGVVGMECTSCPQDRNLVQERVP